MSPVPAYNRPEDHGENIENKRLKDYRDLFNSDLGKNVLLDLIRKNHVFSPAETKEFTSERDMAYSWGRRDVILEILKTIEREPLKLAQEVFSNERRIHANLGR